MAIPRLPRSARSELPSTEEPGSRRRVKATPLLAHDGTLIAATSAAGDPAKAGSLDKVGKELEKAVAALDPRCGPNRAERPQQHVKGRHSNPSAAP